MQKAAIRISQRPVFNYSRRGKGTVQSKRRRRTGSFPSVCAPAFLTTKIETIRPNEDNIDSQFGLDLVKSYNRLFGCCKRFMEVEGIEFKFEPSPTSTLLQRLGELIEYFEGILQPFGVDLLVSKKNPRGGETEVLEYALYRYGRELEDNIIVMYVAPADYLSKEGSKLFKRFMKFFSDSTNIPLGVTCNKENFYLDGVLEWFTGEDEYEEDYIDEEFVESKNTNQEIAAAYRENGKFWHLFEEIKSQQGVTPDSIKKELEDYIIICPSEEVELIKVMLKGVPIIANMNTYWFEFNPEDDGLPDEYGNFDETSWSSSVFASAILYSENDGISDAMLESINAECCAGVMFSGWNIHQWLDQKMETKTIKEFIEYKDLVRKFAVWNSDFYKESCKFDKYGKTE